MNVIVIGGGAAGMMAALAAAQAGHRVLLLERNEKLGKKIYITGKGRCNYTNSAPVEDALSQVVSNRKFLYSAFYDYTSEDITQLLEANGCPTKEERGRRRFPASDHASDVTAALARAMRGAGVKVRLGARVRKILVKDGVVTGVSVSPDKEAGQAETLPADAVILATGGLSYPSTGSDGDGYRLAAEAGHTVTPTRPSLVAFTAEEASMCRRLSGLSLRNILVTLRQNGKKIWSEFGELLFTHTGVSGPLMLTASALYGGRLAQGPIRLEIDWKPALTDEQLRARLLRDLESGPNKSVRNVTGGLLPASAGKELLGLAGIPEEQKAAQVTREQRERIFSLLRAFPLTLTGLGGYSEAVITQGGVSVREVDPSTMRSKLVSGLSFAGEILDVDALTGGFNLQIAWSTGHLAGSRLEG